MTTIDADLTNFNALLIQEGYTDEALRQRALKDPEILNALILLLQARDIEEASREIEPLDVHYKSGILSSKEKLPPSAIEHIRAALRVRMERK